MINQENIELIHASVDGELDATAQAHLEQALAGSEEARNYHAELLEFCEMLEHEPTQELPQGLHQKILNSIVLPSSKAAVPGFSALPGFFRYGLATAAGVLLTVGLMDSQSVSMDSGDLDSMVGTIMSGQGVDAATLDAFSFDLDGLSSSVSLQHRDQALVLDVTINTEQAVDILIDFTRQGLAFDAIAQIHSELESIGINGQAIQISGQGRQHFAVLFHRERDPVEQGVASIKLGFSSNGQLVKEGTLVTN